MAYDLDGDGVKEYFVLLRTMAIGDNCIWGIFALKPARFLGFIFAEHIYLQRRVQGWAALTVSELMSVSDSYYTTFAYRNGKYVRAAGGYETSAYRSDEPKFVVKVPYLCQRH